MLGIKQREMLEKFRKYKRLSTNSFYKLYPSKHFVFSSLNTLEILGYIKFVGNGTYVLIEDETQQKESHPKSEA